MDVLKITPPFFYSYQCSATLLTSYIPVLIYSISFQILITFLTLIIIFSASSMKQCPRWVLALLPGVCWPTDGESLGASDIDLNEKPIQLIKPHQIISKQMNHLILLLSFGLCSPVLCCYIGVSICLHLCVWLLLIGRFVSVRLDALSAPTSSSLSTDRGSLYFLLISSSLIAEADKIVDDPLLRLLDQQLQSVNTSVLVCKWPVTLVSCFFVTLLSWDMAGDKGGWLQALWVPIVGLVMPLVIWICDRLLMTQPTDHPSSKDNPDNAHSLEMVLSSLHQSPDLPGDPKAALDHLESGATNPSNNSCLSTKQVNPAAGSLTRIYSGEPHDVTI
jgi:hypothetical protein